MSDETNAPAGQTPAKETTKDAGKDKRYAPYDETHLRYLGGVYEDRKAAAAAGKEKGPKGHKIEIREV